MINHDRRLIDVHWWLARFGNRLGVCLVWSALITCFGFLERMTVWIVAADARHPLLQLLWSQCFRLAVWIHAAKLHLVLVCNEVSLIFFCFGLGVCYGK